MTTGTTWLDAPARVFMALLFLVSGYGKLANVAATQGYMGAFHVPGVLVWPAAAWELGAGTLLAVGLFTNLVAIGLACWCLLTAAIFHTALADQDQLFNFFKNITMAGAFVLIALHGARGTSLDVWRRVRGINPAGGSGSKRAK